VNALTQSIVGPLTILLTSECVRAAPVSRATRPSVANSESKRSRRLNLPVVADRTREIAIATFVSTFVWIAASPVLGLAAGSSLVIARRSRRAWVEQRKATRLDRDLLPFVEELGRNLRSGTTSIESIRGAAEKFETHAAFASLVRIASAGNGAAEVLTQWEASVPTPSAAHVRQLLHIGEVVGGLRPQFVDGIAASQRESNQLAAEIRVLSDQAKYSAILMSVAPLLFASALVATDDRAKHFLLHTMIGGVLLIVGLGLDAVGLLWMRRLVSRVALSSVSPVSPVSSVSPVSPVSSVSPVSVAS
jgi:tight adherence protein B